MDALMWHAQALTPPPDLPEPLPTARFDALAPAEQQAYWTQLRTILPTAVVPSVLTQRARVRLDLLLARNDHRPPGAKSVIGLSAPFAVGKSTFIKDWAHGRYRAQVALPDPVSLPVWNPRPDQSASWIPQVYITLRAAAKIKDINAAILAYLGYPSEGLIRVTTSRVVTVLATHGVRLLIVDDVHMLNTGSVEGRNVLDYLKFLNTELGELGGTLVLVGANLEGGPLYTDPQIAGRLDKIALAPFEITTPAGRRDWQQLLVDLEQLLLPYFDTIPPGTFSHAYAGPVWRRTQGYVGDTLTLLVESLLGAFDDAEDDLTRHRLDTVALSARAAAAEADMVTAAAQSNRRAARKAKNADAS